MSVAAALAIFITPANASIIENTSFPIDIIVNVPCANGGAGEDVELTGVIHETIIITVNGNRFSMKIHDQPQGVVGIGLTTGDKYQGTGVTQQRQNGSFQNGQASGTFINAFDIIGQGPGNNATLHITEHFTINANGTTTVDFVKATADCK